MDIWGAITSGINKAADGWINAEAEGPCCLICAMMFTITTRRHHCRFCCRLVCGTCSPHTVDLDGDGGMQRVCKECFTNLDTSGLVGQMYSVRAPAKSHFEFTVYNMRNVPTRKPMSTTASQANASSSGKSGCGFQCNVIIGDLIVATSDPNKDLVNPLSPISFLFTADVYSPLEASLVVEIFDTERKGSEIIARSRIPLRICDKCKSSSMRTVSLNSASKIQPIQLVYSIRLLGRPIPPNPARTRRYRVPFSSGLFLKGAINLQSLCLMLKDLFPAATSRLYPKLFQQLPHERRELPQDELVVEIAEQCWVQQQSQLNQSCGVLIFTSHRLLFIEYPDGSWISSGQIGDSYCDDKISNFNVELGTPQMLVGMFFIPVADIKSVGIRRFYNNKFHALEVSCRYGESIFFQFNREVCNELQLLEKLKRIKIEFSWLNEEDKFAFSGSDSSIPQIHHSNVDCMSVVNCANPNINQNNLTQIPSGNFLSPIDSAGQDSIVSEDRGFSFVSVPRDISFSADEVRETVAINELKNGIEKPLNGDPSETLYENIVSYETDLVELSDEYDRLLAPEFISEFWRITMANKTFSLCSSYPPILIAPKDASDELLKAASIERSSNRIPVLTWIHPVNGASLSRSSQPTMGINVSGTPSDEKLLMTIRRTALLFRQHKLDIENKTNCNEEYDHIDDEVDEADVIMEEAGSRANSTDIWRSTWQTVIPPKKNNHLKSVNTAEYDSPVAYRQHSGEISHSISAASLTDVSPTRRAISDGKSSKVASSSLIIENSRLVGSPFENDRSPKAEDSLPKSSEATHTVFAGLMQGFGGTQSIVLRDAEYRKSKYKAFLLKNKALLSAMPTSNDRTEIPQFQSRTKLRVIDARPLISAKGNVLLGKGHEVIDRLGGAECTSVEYAGVGNIHAMRDSYIALRRACLSHSSDNNNNGASTNFLLNIHQSSWLQHISNIIFGSVCTAVNINNGDPVLVHCSDGWDRTSQISALAQLLLDPFYRTIAGFSVLVKKDFIWFGHRFRTRSGFGDLHETAPVFTQFLDCVWQIWRQYPLDFEFNEAMLHVLLYAENSRYYSDFIFDSFLERSAVFSRLQNHNICSVWQHITENISYYLNPLYSKPLNESENICSKAVEVEPLSYDAEEAPPSQIDDDSRSTSTVSVVEEDDVIPISNKDTSLKSLIFDAINSQLPVDPQAGIGVVLTKSKADGNSSHSNVVKTDSKILSPMHTPKKPEKLLRSLNIEEWSPQHRGGPLIVANNQIKMLEKNGKPSRSTRLIIPQCSISSLALWEAAHKLPGVSFFSSQSAGSSKTVERGLLNALLSERDKTIELQNKLNEMSALLDIYEKRNSRLSDKLLRTRVNEDEDGVFIDPEDAECETTAENPRTHRLSGGIDSVVSNRIVSYPAGIIQNAVDSTKSFIKRKI